MGASDGIVGGLIQAESKGCPGQALYSPLFYWVRLLWSFFGAVAGGMIWSQYSTICPDAKSRTILKAWFFLLIALWAFAGFIHAIIIVGRFLKKTPPEPNDALYDGPFARQRLIVWPLIVCYGLVSVLSLVGAVLFHIDITSNDCTSHYAWVIGLAGVYLVVSIITIARILGKSGLKGDKSSTPTPVAADTESPKKEEEDV